MGPGAAEAGAVSREGGRAEPGAEDPRPLRPPDGMLQWATAGYLALLPLGMWIVVPRAGAAATASDALLGALLAVGAGVGLLRLTRRSAADAAGGPGIPGSRSAVLALSLLLAFAAWAALSTLWSPTPSFALHKGVGYLALAAGAGVVAWSGLGWTRGLDVWLVGTGIVLLVTLTALLGPEGWKARVTYAGGFVQGLPVPRLRGPFPHAHGFGDYLVLSGVFLWARWPAWTARPRAPESPRGTRRTGQPWTRRAAFVVGALLVAALVLTASSAWLAAGVLLLFWGRRLARDARRGSRGPGASLRALLLRGAGAAIAGGVLAALVVPVALGVGGLGVATSGIRPRIWASSAAAVAHAPLAGVGSTPYLAWVVDPARPASGTVPWDAHSVYLSVLGQFGVVGFALLAGAVWMLARHLLRPGGSRGGPDLAVVSGDPGPVPPAPVLRDRARLALLAALVAMGVHGIAIAGEDLRHWWAVLGLAATAATAAAAPSGDRA